MIQREREHLKRKKTMIKRWLGSFRRTIMFLRKGTNLIKYSSWLYYTLRYLGWLELKSVIGGGIAKRGNLLGRRLKPRQDARSKSLSDQPVVTLNQL
jgi:hypothetical protein